MQLLIDQGNSSLKWCFYDECESENNTVNNGVVDKHTIIGSVLINNCPVALNSGQLNDLEKEIKVLANKISHVHISSVQEESHLKILIDGIRLVTSAPIDIAHTTSAFQGLKNGYKYIEQMGVDRWLVMVACWQQFNSSFIVVDAGSAMTLDIVDISGQHLGGHIVPGLGLQKSALQSGTDRVNFNLEAKAVATKPGVSTNEAVQNGCLTVLSSYIEAMYQQYDNHGEMHLVITGGDADVLSEALDIEHEVIPGLVLNGLHCFYS